MNHRHMRPVTLRYSACFTLDSGTDVGIQFERINDAAGFVSRIVEPGEWWEIIDNVTHNTVMSAKGDG